MPNPRTRLRDEADRLFSRRVRARGRCESCGSRLDLQCAHIMSRKFMATRWDDGNALCLCLECHHHYTVNPKEWLEFIVELFSREYWDDLWARSHTVTNLTEDDLREVVLRLKE